MDDTTTPRPDVREHLATWGAYAERQTMERALALGADPAKLGPLPDVGPLDALTANRAAVDLLTARRWYVIEAAREQGATWETIGAALGITKQGAQDYYRRQLALQRPDTP